LGARILHRHVCARKPAHNPGLRIWNGRRLTGMLPGSVNCFPQIFASVPILVVQLSSRRDRYVHLNGSLAIDPAPSYPGPVENHLSAHFARDVLPLEVAVVPLGLVVVITHPWSVSTGLRHALAAFERQPRIWHQPPGGRSPVMNSHGYCRCVIPNGGQWCCSASTPASD
jgi:hypothetical protein